MTRRRIFQICTIAVWIAACFCQSPDAKGETYTWLGTNSDDWHLGTNWIQPPGCTGFCSSTPPGSNDFAIARGVALGASDASLSEDTSIRRLTMGDGMYVTTNGHRLTVADFAHVENDSVLGVFDSPSHNLELLTDSLRVSGLLSLIGGNVRAESADNFGSIAGFGEMTFIDDFRNVGEIVVSLGDLTLQAPANESLRLGGSSAARVIVDDGVGPLSGSRTLFVNGSVGDFLGSITIGHSDTAAFSQPWRLGGQEAGTVVFKGDGFISTLAGSKVTMNHPDSRIRIESGIAVIDAELQVDAGFMSIANGHVAFKGGAQFPENSPGIVKTGVTQHSMSVASNVSIPSPMFDWDGENGTDITEIDGGRLTLSDQSLFTGTINMSTYPLRRAELKMLGLSGVWTMDGSLRMRGDENFAEILGAEVRLGANSRTEIYGDYSLISAPVTFLSNSRTEFNNATLTLSGESHIHSGATFIGNGNIVNEGTMLMSSNADIGVMISNEGSLDVTEFVEVNGFTHLPGAEIKFVIRSTTAGIGHDQLIVEEVAELLGGVLTVDPATPYIDPLSPGVIDEFLLLDSNLLNGEFDDVIYDGMTLTWDITTPNRRSSHQGNGLFRSIEHGNDQVRFSNYRALPGDANADGVVDASDFNIWNTNKFVSGTDWQTGDFNGDGVTDTSDFNIWNTNKFTTAGESLPAVPEPTSASLLILGLSALLSVRRRH